MRGNSKKLLIGQILWSSSIMLAGHFFDGGIILADAEAKTGVSCSESFYRKSGSLLFKEARGAMKASGLYPCIDIVYFLLLLLYPIMA